MTLLEEAFAMLEEVKTRFHLYKVTSEVVDELIDEAMKRIQADFDALVFDAVELERLTVENTTLKEQQRVRKFSHEQRETWDVRRG